MRYAFASVRRNSRRAFTITELLVVTATIAVLASLAMVAAARTKAAGDSAVCMNSNLRQLQLASALYATDHNDYLPPNGWSQIEWSDGCPQGYSSADGSWVMGEASAERTEAGIRNGVLFPYVKAAGFYHCPSDKSKVDGSRKLLRKRSYSASYYMNGSKVTGYAQVKAKFSEISQPSTKFVFTEEHENTIDDGVFFLHLPGDKGEQAASHYAENHFYGGHWMSMPSGRHNKGGNFSFADGSVLHHKWRWPKTLLTPDSDRSPKNELDFLDLRWLQSGIPEVAVQYIAAAGSNGPGHP